MTVDEKSVAEYDIKENDVLVLMITKVLKIKNIKLILFLKESFQCRKSCSS